MNCTISAFTHKGTVRDTNQDCIFINGTILTDGEIHLDHANECACFVADGVGGNRAGEFASRFILEELNSILKQSADDLENRLHKINLDLLSISTLDMNLNGTATTLSGLMIHENKLQIFHAGDSQIWLLRDDIIFQITTDHVLDDTEDNSPITSYFGGHQAMLHIDTSTREIEPLPDDILMVCTDGLLKSLKLRTVKSILNMDTEMSSKSGILLENCLRNGANDNISVIIIKYSDHNG